MTYPMTDHAPRTKAARVTVNYVIGYDGRRLTLSDLPSPDTKRWVVQRKAEVIAAVRGGLLSLEDACSRYALNSDEYLTWQHCIDRFGLAGLRATRTQFYLNVARPKGSSVPLESFARMDRKGALLSRA
jgi:hypothetical protein